MTRRSTEELDEGMVTNEPVLDASGNVVLREGIRLTGKIITALRHRGVTSVDISRVEAKSTGEQNEKPGLTEEERNRAYEQIDKKIGKIFEGQKDRRMLELAEAARRYHKSKIR